VYDCAQPQVVVVLFKVDRRLEVVRPTAKAAPAQKKVFGSEMRQKRPSLKNDNRLA